MHHITVPERFTVRLHKIAKKYVLDRQTDIQTQDSHSEKYSKVTGQKEVNAQLYSIPKQIENKRLTA